MSRIFNLLLEHQGKSYPALLTIAGHKENTIVRVVSNEQKIEVIVPNGTLTFSTKEVMKQLLSNGPGTPAVMQVTSSISLQLLNNNW